MIKEIHTFNSNEVSSIASSIECNGGTVVSIVTTALDTPKAFPGTNHDRFIIYFRYSNPMELTDIASSLGLSANDFM